MPVVSVLMPCYNAAATLSEALDSLQQQTLDDFEIVAVDDGSSDTTRQILKDFAARDDRLRVVAIPHCGIIVALNAGLVHCRSALVARMDADDRSLPQRLELQAGYLAAHPEIDVVSCQVAVFPQEQARPGFGAYVEWLNGLLCDAQIRREIFIESPLPHPSLVARREVLLRLGGYQERGWAEDYDLLLRLYLAGARFAKLDRVLLRWREHAQRLTRSDSRYSLENFMRAKAYYLMRGPLACCDAVIIWGAGMVGRRLGKELAGQGAPLVGYVDINARKIGQKRGGVPIIAAEELAACRAQYQTPIILAAVGARGARSIIRCRLTAMGLLEGRDWWCIA